ncbi:MAG: hypothetical protein JXR40_10320 [Pontiellaceae bacterium]|nr:hypothetical protein [Pontiellaceae bacterium]
MENDIMHGGLCPTCGTTKGKTAKTAEVRGRGRRNGCGSAEGPKDGSASAMPMAFFQE